MSLRIITIEQTSGDEALPRGYCDDELQRFSVERLRRAARRPRQVCGGWFGRCPAFRPRASEDEK